jgi:hypothetical protein
MVPFHRLPIDAPPWKAGYQVCALFSHFPKNDEKFICLCLSLKENKFTVPQSHIGLEGTRSVMQKRPHQGIATVEIPGGVTPP